VAFAIDDAVPRRASRVTAVRPVESESPDYNGEATVRSNLEPGLFERSARVPRDAVPSARWTPYVLPRHSRPMKVVMIIAIVILAAVLWRRFASPS